ncbi:MAG TPA: riboflavin biosynthesis protein RibF [Fimbriimonadaceae bacterium]|nr:riboflavin biosynthesis protein RibF [Fimbriimonadaceae bacterium]
MLILFGAAGLDPQWPATVLCLGTFDGFHLGHQAVIRKAVAIARAADLPCGLVTFDRHPAMTLAPERAPSTLSQPTDNLSLLSDLGVDLTVVLAFDRALSETSAEDFLATILQAQLHGSHLVVGHDFAFGHDRLGTTDWLEARVQTTVVPPFELDGVRVSSSAIRAAVASGDLATAGRMLGRPFALRGVVISGDKLGRQLGFPTANLGLPARHILPPDGVYVAQAVTPFGQFAAAVSIGDRPTVNGTNRVIEAHLLDFSGESLYGRSVTLQLVSHIREQRRLASLEELKEWINNDIETVRGCLSG